jgi:GntR family transcriptional regulator, transcriptional repressor for pyruvate dehydrogenase complex
MDAISWRQPAIFTACLIENLYYSYTPVKLTSRKTSVTPKPQSTTQRWSRWQEVRPQSVSSRIVDQVRAALFRGELKPGDVLGSETDLARKFGVSRVPVRDAFKTLQALGIVEVKMGANGGARIAAGDPNRFADALAVQLKLVGISVAEMFDAQIAVEVMATELAAKQASADDLAKLRAILRQLQAMSQKSLTEATAARFTETAMHFHAGLVDAAHNRALSAQFKALRVVLEPIYGRRTSNAVTKRVVSADKAVLDAVEAGDAERACRLIRRRLETIRAHQLFETVTK